ncbi:MAG: DUF2779 domain-containing protein [Bacteroidales bacterium]|nr:DUF2779 domain-containing protein [Bacteroidales bacterium]MBN2698591.1 DUF2779 domain-containing protein [Bacteroidales bacterium]
MTRFLTKSRFKLAMECPAKLYYTSKPEYPDQSATDPFLAALAEGGFQVGELARSYYPGGHNITTLDFDEAVEQTNVLLEQEHVVIFEAAFRYNNLFIRADILEKNGNSINLVEVKSKSFDGDDAVFIGKRSGRIAPGWQPYLFDVAFQKYVIMKARPGFKVTAYLMMADKNKAATVDGLNQKFELIKADDERTYCRTVGDLSPEALGEEILIRENVDDIINMIHEGAQRADAQDAEFESWIEKLADHYVRDEQIYVPVHKGCGSCQFRCTREEEQQGKKSGFKACWLSKTPLTEEDLEKPLIFELWRGGLGSKDIITCLINDSVWFLKDIREEYYAPKNGKDYPYLSPTGRRRLQVEKTRDNDRSPYIDLEGLKAEMADWKYPLHFIDFETAIVAIPFNKGLKPYEGIAFQFSHHRVDRDGTITHAGQYLNPIRGKFPNFDFIRELKKQLEGDEGTVFRYATHENTFLNIIYKQLHESGESDRHDLMQFIRSISRSGRDNVEQWEGPRNMVDMLEVVKKYYYDPAMRGSNSIKVVLPAVLNASGYLKQKYSVPIYGKGREIESKNFEEMTWIREENGKVKNPYDLLPPLFEGVAADELDKFITDPKLADGGAAMMAYARMQFTSMPAEERKLVEKGLLRYCELDTLAMVFIWEYWNSL